MRYERQVFLAPLLHLQCRLFRVRFHSQTDRFIQHAVQDVERPAPHHQVVIQRQIVHAATQDVVLAHHFRQVEAVLEPLDAVLGWRAIAKFVRDVLLRGLLQRIGQLHQQRGYMIVQRGDVQPGRRRQLAHLIAPRFQQRLLMLPDEFGQFADHYC